MTDEPLRALVRAGLEPGVRVVIRYRLAGRTGPTGGPLATDVIGVVRSVTASIVEVEDRTGEVVTVPVEAIVAAKPVPPPARRREPRGG